MSALWKLAFLVAIVGVCADEHNHIVSVNIGAENQGRVWWYKGEKVGFSELKFFGILLIVIM